jgi:kynurenine formamidase
MKTPLIAVLVCAICNSQEIPKGWTKGKGYGWVYGKDDEIGALNAINTPQRILRALQQVKSGRVFDLGVRIDQRSYKWPGHSPTQIMTYRGPNGVSLSKETMAHSTAWHSCALFISDNVGTQIDGLGHITTGTDNHWYNGFREQEHGGDFGISKADADTIPPIIGRAVLIDVAGWKGVDALPANFPVGSKEMRAALSVQKVDIEPGDIVFIRTGTLRYWGEVGADHAKIQQHDSAGLTLEGAKWLVEQKGAAFVGGDTSGVEVGQDPAHPKDANRVHVYLLVEQGIHLGEFHYLEDLAREKIYRFTYVAMTNRLKGTVAGTALRPIAIY